MSSTPAIEWNIAGTHYKAVRVVMSNRHGNTPISFWRIFKDGSRMDNRLTREAVRRYRRRMLDHENS